MSSVPAEEQDRSSRRWLRTSGDRTLLWVGLAIYVVAFTGSGIVSGLPLSTDRALLWVLAALFVASLGNLKAFARGVLIDWGPFLLMVAGYILVTDHAAGLVNRAHVTPQIRADQAMFGGHVPTLWLQERFWVEGHPHWYDYFAWFIYVSHFWLPLTLGVVLWIVARPTFRRYIGTLMSLSMVSYVTYWAFPAAPPWLASMWWHLEPTTRLVSTMWTRSGQTQAPALVAFGEHYANPVAAIPSLHAAIPMMIALLFWPRTRSWLIRGLLAFYVVAMGLVLVYSAEHWVIDILIGWVYAVAAHLAVSRFLRWRTDRRTAAAVDSEIDELDDAAEVADEERRMRDSNSRGVAPNTLS
jgi:hypothetical protein